MANPFRRLRNAIFGDASKTTVSDFNQRVESSVYSQSPEMQAVSAAVVQVNALHSQAISETNMQQMHDAQKQLVTACDQYIAAKGTSFSLHGSHRKAMVSTIRGLAVNEDVNKYRDPAQMDAAKKARWTWKRAAAESRVRKIDVASAQITKVGAGASTRLHIQQGNVDGYFTEAQTLNEQILSTYSDMRAVCSQNTIDTLCQLGRVSGATVDVATQLVKTSTPDLTPEEKRTDILFKIESFMKDTEEYESTKALIETASPEEIVKIHEFYRGLGRAYNGNEQAMDAGIELSTRNADGTVTARSVGDRNVATSRLAQMTGASSVIANSEFVTLVDGDKVTKGVMMAKAEGTDIAKRIPEFLSTTKALVSPEAARQMVMLQALDVMAGQIDRHNANMFYQMSEPDANGKRQVLGIQGIDNDLAFGNIRATTNGLGQNTETPDTIKYIDRAFRDQINGIDLDKLKYVYGDILNDAEINSMWGRVQEVQRCIKNAKPLEPDEWTEDIVVELAAESRGYVGRIYQGTSANDPESTSKVEAYKEAEAQKKAAAKAEATSEEQLTSTSQAAAEAAEAEAAKEEPTMEEQPTSTSQAAAETAKAKAAKEEPTMEEQPTSTSQAAAEDTKEEPTMEEQPTSTSQAAAEAAKEEPAKEADTLDMELPSAGGMDPTIQVSQDDLDKSTSLGKTWKQPEKMNFNQFSAEGATRSRLGSRAAQERSAERSTEKGAEKGSSEKKGIDLSLD